MTCTTLIAQVAERRGVIVLLTRQNVEKSIKDYEGAIARDYCADSFLISLLTGGVDIAFHLHCSRLMVLKLNTPLLCQLHLSYRFYHYVHVQ